MGPLIFDLAVCAIGTCFNPSPANDLDYDRLEALLNGYCSTSRTLTPTEVDHFVPFMRLALMVGYAISACPPPRRLPTLLAPLPPTPHSTSATAPGAS